MPSKSELAKAPVRAIIRSVGTQMVSGDAIDILTEAAIHYIRDVAIDALKLVRHANRTKMTGEDVDFVLKMRKEKQ